MRWTDWFALTKAKCGAPGLGNTTFSDCTKRLLDQHKVRKSQIEKNKFYQAILAPRSLARDASSRSENGGNDHDPIAPAPDKAAQALAFLLNQKSSGVV